MKKNKYNQGFTLLEIMLVVAIIGLLAAITIPSIMKARNKSQTTVCINNLRQINSAKAQWALINYKRDGDPVDASDMSGSDGIDSYIKGGAPSCPAGGTYNYQPVGTNATCSVSDHVLN